MQTERESKPALMAPSSSTEHSGDQQPRAGAVVVKRKRTKRPRHHPPASSSSSASSSESTTTEEEDMAHCLILLAQGGAGAVVDSKPSSPPTAAPPPPVLRSERYTSRRYTADGVKAGFYVYECRTCSKCFPTFQALGGHRASHKKPRLATTAADDEEIANAAINVAKQPANKPSPPLLPPRVVDIAAVFPDVTTALSLSNSHTAAAAGSSRSKLLRVHECSICRAEFASGQALGGHMRRHRPLNAPERAVTAITMLDTKKEEGSAGINLELLDLNLPAPPDEEEAVSSLILPAVVLGGLGQFNDGKEAGLMLTASALVDCHY